MEDRLSKVEKEIEYLKQGEKIVYVFSELNECNGHFEIVACYPKAKKVFKAAKNSLECEMISHEQIEELEFGDYIQSDCYGSGTTVRIEKFLMNDY